MATMITGKQLKEAVLSQSIIQGGNVDCVEGVKYDFRSSPHILKAKFGRPIDATELSQSEKADLVVEPDEVVFVLSEERLILPKDVIAQLSPKRKMSQLGVLTLGGLTVDPGYKGRLLVGLLNYSSTPFILKPGKKLIAATFLRLSSAETEELEVCTESLEDFPDELVEVMQKYRPIGTKFLVEGLQKLENEIGVIKKELRDHDDWRQRLDRHDAQIENILKGLESEKQARERGEDKLSKTFDGMKTDFQLIKGGAIALYVLIGAILASIIAYAPNIIAWIKKL
jgi:deoxycytidine triphosphate deaminase